MRMAALSQESQAGRGVNRETSGEGVGQTSFVGKPDLAFDLDGGGDLAGHGDGLDCAVVLDFWDVVLPGVSGRAGCVFGEGREGGGGEGEEGGPGEADALAGGLSAVRHGGTDKRSHGCP